jgi:photosystem II stability/assembly factor-like uncharacterized protein
MYHNEHAVGWTVGTDADKKGIILYTADGGQTWNRQYPDVDEFSPEKVCAVDVKTAWIAGDSGLVLHTIDGKHWKKQIVPEKYRSVGFCGVSAVDKEHAWIAGFDGAILHTTHGKDWAPPPGSSTIPDVLLQGVYAVNDNTVWVTGDVYHGYGTIFRTQDGGVTWERLGYKSQEKGDGGLPDREIMGVNPFDATTAWAIGSHNAYILKTEDSGRTWIDQTEYAPRDANGIILLKDQNTGKPTGWVVEDHDVIFHTEDGEKWTPQDNPSHGNFLLDVSAVDEKTAWVVGTAESGEDGVILHTANGKDWNQQYYTEGGKPVKVALSGVSFVPL